MYTGRATRINHDRPVSFCALRGNGVARSTFIIRIGQLKIMFDPGMGYNDLHSMDVVSRGDVQDVDYIFLTHAHTDHVGALFDVLRQNSRAKVLCTRATKDITDCLLRRLNGSLSWGLSDSAIVRLLHRVETYDYGVEIELRNHVRGKFIPAGHTLGSASVVLACREGNFLISGDIETYTSGMFVPFKAPDIILRASIMEGSLVGLDAPPVDLEAQRLLARVKERQEERKSMVLIADALSPMTVLFFLLADRQRTGHFPSFGLFVSSYHADMIRWLRVYREEFQFVQEAILNEEDRYRLLHQVPLAEQERLLVEAAPLCLLAGPANMRPDKDFPSDLARAVLMGGGHICCGNRIPVPSVLRRLTGQKEGPSLSRIDSFSWKTHVGERDLAALITQMRSEKTLLVHGGKPSLIRFAETMQRSLRHSQVAIAPVRTSVSL